MKQYVIHVKGKVQGVNFRNFVKQQAIGLGIQGTVCNTNDGSVLIHAEGKEIEMQLFLDRCVEGPIIAKVTSMCCAEVEWKGYSGFVIN